MLAAGIRGAALGRFSLDNDEIMEARWSALPLSRLLHSVATDGVHPPLDYLVQAATSRVSGSDVARRLPSVVAGVATVALVMLLGVRWFGGIAGLASGLFLALSPIHVRFSQEVRPYSLGLLFLVGAVAALEEHRRTRGAWSATIWFVAVLAAAYTLYFAGLVAVVVSVGFAFAHRSSGLERVWRRLPIALAGWFLLYLPWIPFVIRVARGKPKLDREGIDGAWLWYRLQVLGTGDWKVEPVSLGSYAFWFLVVLGIALAWRRRPAGVAVFWLAAGCALQVLVLQVHPHYPAVRYLLPSWIGAVLLAGYGLSELAARAPALRLTGWIALIAVLIFDARTLRDYYDHGRPQWDRVAAFLREGSRPGDRIVAANAWTFRNLGYYWNDLRLGRPDAPLERAGPDLAGPAWLVIAVCPVQPGVGSQLERLPLARSFETTNHCEVRYVPAGRTLSSPLGLCAGDVWTPDP